MAHTKHPCAARGEHMGGEGELQEDARDDRLRIGAPIIQQLLRVIDAYTISAADIASLTATRAAASGLLGKLVNQAFTVFNLFGVLTIILIAVAVSVNYEATPRKAAYVTVLAYVVYMILRVYLPVI